MKSEPSLNEKVTRGLRAQFSHDRAETVLAQAQSMFQESAYRSAGKEPNSAEPYELFESGWIDSALEFLGFGRWAIGRPKNGREARLPSGHLEVPVQTNRTMRPLRR